FFMSVFLVISIVFLFIHLMMGKMIRPARPDADKLTIYECGEPTIGSAWVQFDLRYYVIALLFVIFDVEVAFFFPWAVVFGKANTLSHTDDPAAVAQQVRELVPAYPENAGALAPYQEGNPRYPPTKGQIAADQQAAHQVAWFAF